MLERLPFLLAALLVGCFEPSFNDGSIACGEAGCPPGMSCGDDGFCYLDPTSDPVGDPGSSATELVLAVGHDGGVRLYTMCGNELRSVWTSSGGPEARQVAWGDVDGDGIPELAAANLVGAAVIYTRTADGFAERARAGNVAASRGVALTDVDGDGDDDLVVGHDGGPLRLYRANGGALEASWASASSQSNWELAVGDYDGDGYPDLGVAVNDGADQVYRNEGGLLTLAWTTNVIAATEAVAWGDVDGDGRMDLAVAGTDVPARVYGFGGAGFSQLWQSPLDRDDAEALDFADYDRDGDVDLAIGNWDDPDRVFRNTGDNLVEAWSSSGSKADGQGGNSTVYGTETLSWIDVDGDSDLDLHLGRHSDQDLLLRNDGGSFNQMWSSPERDATRSARWLRWQRPAGYASLCD